MDKPNYVPNQILAMQKAGVSEEQVHQTIGKAGGTILKKSSNGRLTMLVINVEDVENATKLLQESGHFDSVQLNYLSHH